MQKMTSRLRLERLLIMRATIVDHKANFPHFNLTFVEVACRSPKVRPTQQQKHQVSASSNYRILEFLQISVIL